MENDISIFFEKGEITPFFQPILNTQNNKIEKYEVLCRVTIDSELKNPFALFGEKLPPEIYKKITLEILEKFIAKMENEEIEFSINLTKFDLEDDEHLEKIQKILDNGGEKTKRLVFEITEGEEFKETDDLKKIIESFKSKYGCKFALDDFGKGYSNITYISDLNFDFIKFDGSLIQKIESVKTEQIINYLAQLFTNLNMEVIAEFVKDEQIFRKLEKLQVKYFQGHYIGFGSVDFK